MEENKNKSNIREWLGQFKSEETTKRYKMTMKDFFACVYELERAKISDETLYELGDKYLSEERNYQEDISKFFSQIKDRPPKTISLFLSIVRSFLSENEIELNNYWKKLRGRIRGNRALTMDRIPGNEELRKIIGNMDLNGKALYMLLSSSGMRIGEALQLKLSDIDMDNCRVTIRGEYTKTGNPRYAFFSEETKSFLEDWLKHRGEYLNIAIKKSKFKKEEKTELLFPFSSANALQVWTNAVKKNGSYERDSSTGRLTLHPHSLRKFFRTKLGQVNVDITEALMGHEGYLTEVYRRYSTEDLQRWYKENEHVLSIFTDRAKIGELEKKVETRDKAMNELLQGVIRENMELKKDMEELKQRDKELAPILKALLEDPEVKEVLIKKLKGTNEGTNDYKENK